MKKHLALVLALVMVLSSFSFVSAAPDFSDVEGTMYEDAVGRLELLDILNGYPDGTFKPENTITRAEFAAVAVRTLGLAGAAQSATGLPSGFSDVPAWHWAAGYVGVAANAGIVNGIGNGLFAPEAPVKYEEAVTMLVRALGYEPEAQAKGGYPYGYLIVAEQIDLLDGVRATQGTFASRGTVAMLTDNALELPMMVSIGFGDNIRWVVSGTERTEEVTLLDEMGYDAVEGRIVAYDDDDMEIELNDEISEDFDGTYEVAEGFDFYAHHGAVVKAWVDGDEVIAVKVTEDVMFDALEVTKTEEEIKLIDANKKYDVDADALVWINGEEADVEDLVDNDMHNLAKVGLNDDGDVMFIDGYTWDGFIVFDELDEDDDFIYGADWELDIEDFTFVKDGMTIAVTDLEEGDMVFYNEDADFAEVFNMSVEGEFEEIFSTTFELEGEEFEYTLDNFTEVVNVQYVDEDGDMAAFDDDVAIQMEEEGEVAVFVDRFGNAVFVTGDLGPVQKSTFGALLHDDMSAYVDIRGRDYLELAVVTEMGEEATYDFRLSNLETIKVDGDIVWEDTEAYGDLELGGSEVGPQNIIQEVEDGEVFDTEDYPQGTVVEITVDVDGDVVGLNFFDNEVVSESVDGAEAGDRYIESMRMSSDVPLFFISESIDVLNDSFDGDDVEVVMFGDLEEDVMLNEYDLYNNGSAALYMVVFESDMEALVEELVVVTEVRLNSDDDVTRIRAFVGSTEKTFYTEDPISKTLNEGDAVVLEIIESSERVNDFAAAPHISGEMDAPAPTTDWVNRGSREITINNVTYKLVDDGAIIDISDKTDIETMSFSELNDVEEDTPITMVFENENNTKYVKYVLVGKVTAPTVTDVDFDLTSSSAIVLPVTDQATWGRTVEVTVVAGVDFDDTDDVTLDRASFTVSGIEARSAVVSGTNEIRLVFVEDIYVGDTLEVAADAITITIGNTVYENKTGDIVIEQAN